MHWEWVAVYFLQSFIVQVVSVLLKFLINNSNSVFQILNIYFYIAPSVASAKDKSYPISRPLFYIFDKANAGKVKTVVDYALSPEGQKNVSEVGYVPLK